MQVDCLVISPFTGGAPINTDFGTRWGDLRLWEGLAMDSAVLGAMGHRDASEDLNIFGGSRIRFMGTQQQTTPN